ncbi:PQQ-binding-like beta-propeller repeat protein [Brevundimonas sp.]|uniref:PQQ-like beta-propeller repeat protein n=1 Tax=Brevundimonas sp. TaxID=1871086 RepID=UPI001E19C66A|nr:PQQ-binding-like beta-propeller repeat protein [Brevundimonas sp.]MBA4000552.1 dehydrogenase [Brevundimonas sp.]
MSQPLKIALVCGLAVTVASCSTAQRLWPFGGDDAPSSVASAGERVSILEFEQSLSPSTALSGRDFFVPGPQAINAWPVPGGNVEQSLEHVIAAPEFTVAWRRDIGQGASRTTQVTAPPVAADGRIYVMDGEARVSAVDANTGQILWQTNLRPEGRDRAFGGGVAVSGERVFVTSGYRMAAGLNARTGAVEWTTQFDAPIHGAPTVAGGRVFAVDVDNQIVAMDAATGAMTWSYQAISEPARLMRASSPAVTGDTVIAPFSSGEVVALRAANGQELWTQVLSRTSRTNALSEIRDIAGRPAVSRGVVYAVSHSGLISAMDVRTGQPVWQLPLTGVNAPWVAGDVVYAVSKGGELTVINRQDGQVYWIRDINEGRTRTEGGWFFGVGKRTVRPVWSGPILASNRLILVNSDGQAVAYDHKTGQEVASLNLGAPAYIAPIAYNGALYVVTDNGQLVSIR